MSGQVIDRVDLADQAGSMLLCDWMAEAVKDGRNLMRIDGEGKILWKASLYFDNARRSQTCCHGESTWTSMDTFLFKLADFLSRPPGFYLVIVLVALATLMIPFGGTNIINYALSVSAIVITGVVLIQGYRDTAAIHAKLDEIVLAMRETRNEVVGLEHESPAKIEKTIESLENEAAQ